MLLLQDSMIGFMMFLGQTTELWQAGLQGQFQLLPRRNGA
jgi:hypothetical protein